MPNMKSKEVVTMTSIDRSKSQSARGRDRRVQIVRVLLEDQFHRKLPLREMGKAVSLSPWRLAHLFKSETGVSPQRYLTLVRLQRAKDRLENGFLPIREVGASVGMPNPSQFTKTFKAAYGMPPVEYRKAFLRIDTPRNDMDSLVTPQVHRGSLRQRVGDVNEELDWRSEPANMKYGRKVMR